LDLTKDAQELKENGVVVLRSFYDDQDMAIISNAINGAIAKPSPFKSYNHTAQGSFYMDFANWRRVRELEVGQSQSYTVKITERLIDEFASFSDDKNPIHISESEASKSIFKKRVAHGFLISSFFSSMYSNFLPGKGSIILEQQFQFLNR
jgi:hypothetical protein